jgi:hypothetical protein
MEVRHCQLSKDCFFEATTYDNGWPPSLSLEYVEHSSDHWHNNEDTSVDITPEKASELIAFLEPFANCPTTTEPQP